MKRFTKTVTSVFVCQFSFVHQNRFSWKSKLEKKECYTTESTNNKKFDWKRRKKVRLFNIDTIQGNKNIFFVTKIPLDWSTFEICRVKARREKKGMNNKWKRGKFFTNRPNVSVFCMFVQVSIFFVHSF